MIWWLSWEAAAVFYSEKVVDVEWSGNVRLCLPRVFMLACLVFAPWKCFRLVELECVCDSDVLVTKITGSTRTGSDESRKLNPLSFSSSSTPSFEQTKFSCVRSSLSRFISSFFTFGYDLQQVDQISLFFKVFVDQSVDFRVVIGFMSLSHFNTRVKSRVKMQFFTFFFACCFLSTVLKIRVQTVWIWFLCVKMFWFLLRIFVTLTLI